MPICVIRSTPWIHYISWGSLSNIMLLCLHSPHPDLLRQDNLPFQIPANDLFHETIDHHRRLHIPPSPTLDTMPCKHFYRERWIVNEKTKFSQRLIVTFSYKYRDYLRFLRQREIDKAGSNARGSRTSAKSYKSPDRFLSETYATEDGEVAVFRTVALRARSLKFRGRRGGDF